MISSHYTYQNEHLPDAVKAFSAAGAWRGWSDLDDNVQIAFYELADLAEVNRVMASNGFKQTIGEFDRHWQGKVTRTREVVESVQVLETRNDAIGERLEHRACRRLVVHGGKSKHEAAEGAMRDSGLLPTCRFAVPATGPSGLTRPRAAAAPSSRSPRP